MPLNQFGHRQIEVEGPGHIHRESVRHLGEPNSLVGIVQLTCRTDAPLLPGVPTKVDGSTMVTFPDPAIAKIFLELIYTNVLPMLQEAALVADQLGGDAWSADGAPTTVAMGKPKKENWN